MDRNKPRVLVIEDEAGARDSLRMILQPFNSVYTAENGHKALEVLTEHQIDVITLDLKLPDFNGGDLLWKIKDIRPDVQVIIVTGFGDFKSSMEAIQSDVFSYLTKPFNIADILYWVNLAVEKKTQLDRLKLFLTDLGNLIGKTSSVEEGIRQLKEDHSLLENVKKLLGKTEREMDQINRDRHFEFYRILVETIEKTDPFANGHSSRVNFYSIMIGHRLHLNHLEEEDLQIGANLHDIGKLGIKRGITQKIGKLTENEIEAMKKHPEIGVNMISPLEVSPDILSIIQHHHEHFDGTGYPDGLREDEIPRLARITTVADAFDGMTSDYPYELKKLLIDDAMNELKRCSGTQFDPEVVKALDEIIKDEKEKLIIKSLMFSMI